MASCAVIAWIEVLCPRLLNFSGVDDSKGVTGLLPVFIHTHREITMSAPHDICQDLNMTGEEMHERRKNDSELDELMTEYGDLDQRIVDAEKPTSAFISDEEMTAMKSQRLELKDRIMQRVESSQAGG